MVNVLYLLVLTSVVRFDMVVGNVELSLNSFSISRADENFVVVGELFRSVSSSMNLISSNNSDVFCMQFMFVMPAVAAAAVVVIVDVGIGANSD